MHCGLTYSRCTLALILFSQTIIYVQPLNLSYIISLRTYAGNSSCTANCLTLYIFSFIYWLTVWPGMTPRSTVFQKICANNSVSGLCDKISCRLTFNNFIILREQYRKWYWYTSAAHLSRWDRNLQCQFSTLPKNPLNKSVSSILWILQEIVTLEISQNKFYSLEGVNIQERNKRKVRVIVLISFLWEKIYPYLNCSKFRN